MELIVKILRVIYTFAASYIMIKEAGKDLILTELQSQ